MAAIEDLKRIGMFQDLPDSDLKDILQYCREREFHEGETVFTCGDPGHEFFLLLDGNVKLMLPTDQGFGLTVVFVENGNAFGVSGLLEPRTYTSTAVCVKKAKTIAIETGAFLDYMDEINVKAGETVMKNLAAILLRRLDKTRQQLKSLISQVEITSG